MPANPAGLHSPVDAPLERVCAHRLGGAGHDVSAGDLWEQEVYQGDPERDDAGFLAFPTILARRVSRSISVHASAAVSAALSPAYAPSATPRRKSSGAPARAGQRRLSQRALEALSRDVGDLAEWLGRRRDAQTCVPV